MDGQRTPPQLELRTTPNGETESAPDSVSHSALNSYRLQCLGCDYTMIVDGIKPALKMSIDHEEQHGDDHFVELELIDE